MKVLNYYVESWRRYADFQGRTSRAAYWWAFLISGIIVFVLGGISASIWNLDNDDMGPLEGIYMLAYLIPSIAIGVRRLHDVGRSGKWVFVALTGIGCFVLLWWYCSRSWPEDNEWGPAVANDATLRGGDDEPKQAQGPSDIIR